MRETTLMKVLSLQETPLGCSSRMPGNLQCFWCFLKWIKSSDLYDLPLSRHALNSIRYKAFSYHCLEVDNMVQGWKTHHAGRFIHKIDIYKWLNYDKESTYNSNNKYANMMTDIGHQLS